MANTAARISLFLRLFILSSYICIFSSSLNVSTNPYPEFSTIFFIFSKLYLFSSYSMLTFSVAIFTFAFISSFLLRAFSTVLAQAAQLIPVTLKVLFFIFPPPLFVFLIYNIYYSEQHFPFFFSC